MKLAHSPASLVIHLLFGLALLANFGFWLQSRHVLARWDNVPEAPSPAAVSFTAIGDKEISYRMIGYFLQNLGNVGGNFESLKDYDYAGLEKWFFIAQSLDDRADYVPMMAAYYFGAVQDSPDKIAHVIRYLEAEGQKAYPQKWRWLAQAVYLARYQEKDMSHALELARKLAALKTDTAPWARQMPAFIELQMGNKEASYDIMIQMLASEADKLHPNEVNFMKDYICHRTLTAEQAAKNPLCQTAP